MKILLSNNRSGPAWTDPDLTNPHMVEDKARRVEQMFAAIAPSYDLNNRLHSLGRDQAWRRAAVRMAQVNQDDIVLDVACGTGDLTAAFVDSATGSPRRVLGVDFTMEMLKLARGKRDGRLISYQRGDAMRLPVEDCSVDVVSIAFGIRNVTEPMLVMEEFYRVLRPGGRVLILEFSTPTNRYFQALYGVYFKYIMPRTATLIARDPTGAYKYLPKSVNTFLDRTALVKMIEDSGFVEVQMKPLTFGISICYRAVKKR